MKMFIIPLIIAVAVGIPTLVGVIPAIIGVMALLGLIVIKDMILWAFARGPPEVLMQARMSGGIVWAAVKRTKEIVLDRFHPTAGMVNTKKHGSFNLMPSRIYSLGGIPFAIAPEKVGYNIGVDHAQLTEELKNRGINRIEEVCELNQFNQVVSFKDDPRIKDLREKYVDLDGNIKSGGMEVKPEMVTFDDLYRYTTEAANPIHQDANIKIGIAQGILGQEMKKIGWLVGAGILIFLVCIGVFILLQGRGEQVIQIITDNAGRVVGPVIPA